MHNQAVLEKDGLTLHSVASAVGCVKVLWLVIKMLLALVSLPKLPVEPLEEWTVADAQSIDAARATTAKVQLDLRQVLEHNGYGTGGFDDAFKQICDSPNECLTFAMFYDQASTPSAHPLASFVNQHFTSNIWGSDEAAWLAFLCAAGQRQAYNTTNTTIVSLVRNRWNPNDIMPRMISVPEFVCSCDEFDSEKSMAYVRAKLMAPAKLMGWNLPYSVQANMTFAMVLALQGCIEILVKGIKGPPSFDQLKGPDSTGWFFLTFRVEVLGPFLYLLFRGALIMSQSVSFFGGRHAQPLLLVMIAKLVTRQNYGGPSPAPLIVHVAQLPSIVIFVILSYSSIGFVPAILCQEFGMVLGGMILGGMVLGASCTRSARLNRFSPMLARAFTAVWNLGWAIIVSWFMKSRFSADTYLCTFSREVVVSTNLTNFDVSDFGNYMLMVLAMVAIVSAVLCLAGFCMIVPSLLSPDLVYRLWLYQSQHLLGIMLDKRVVHDCYDDLQRDLQQSKEKLSERAKQRQQYDAPLGEEAAALLP